MRSMKSFNRGVGDFPVRVVDGNVSVDKTARLYEFAKPGVGIHSFLPRPFRF